MKEVTLRVPEKNFGFFIKLIRQLGYVEIPNEIKDVPDHHKKIISERLKTLNSKELFDWEKVKNDFIPG